jgi:hypothetical protein
LITGGAVKSSSLLHEVASIIKEAMAINCLEKKLFLIIKYLKKLYYLNV